MQNGGVAHKHAFVVLDKAVCGGRAGARWAPKSPARAGRHARTHARTHAHKHPEPPRDLQRDLQTPTADRHALNHPSTPSLGSALRHVVVWGDSGARGAACPPPHQPAAAAMARRPTPLPPSNNTPCSNTRARDRGARHKIRRAQHAKAHPRSTASGMSRATGRLKQTIYTRPVLPTAAAASKAQRGRARATPRPVHTPHARWRAKPDHAAGQPTANDHDNWHHTRSNV
jgi:hypothetical protein